MAKTSPLKNLEKSLAELEDLVQQLEKGDLALDDALKQFEQGIKLTRDCQQALTEAEQKVRILLGDGDNATLEPFDSSAA